MAKKTAPALLADIDGKIAKLEQISSRRYKCGGTNLTGFNNIQVETKVENLIRAYSHVERQKDDYDKQKALFGVKDPLKIDGFDAQDWLDDILLRKDVLQQTDKLKKLKDLRTKVSALMTDDEQIDDADKENDGIKV